MQGVFFLNKPVANSLQPKEPNYNAPFWLAVQVANPSSEVPKAFMHATGWGFQLHPEGVLRLWETTHRLHGPQNTTQTLPESSSKVCGRVFKGFSRDCYPHKSIIRVGLGTHGSQGATALFLEKVWVKVTSNTTIFRLTCHLKFCKCYSFQLYTEKLTWCILQELEKLHRFRVMKIN